MNLSPFLYGLSELIGSTATLLLVDKFGGVPLYVPKHMDAEHHLAQLIGLEAATELVKTYPGEVISIGLSVTGDHAHHSAERRKAIHRLKAQGLSHRQIARELRTTDRTVRKVLGQEVDDRQGGLF